MNTAKAKKTRRATERSTAEQSAPLRLTLSLLRGLAVALLLTLALSLIATAVAYGNTDPDTLILPLGLGILAIAALVCGFVTRHTSHLAPLLCGALSGLSLLVLHFILSPLIPTNAQSGLTPALCWGLRGGVVAFSLLGSFLGANLPKKKKRPRRHS